MVDWVLLVYPMQLEKQVAHELRARIVECCRRFGICGCLYLL